MSFVYRFGLRLMGWRVWAGRRGGVMVLGSEREWGMVQSIVLWIGRMKVEDDVWVEVEVTEIQ